jgi:cell wall-associated NlpC family hydrolase
MSEEFTPRAITGADVVREAREWLGAPYKAAGATREGVCCAGLPFGVGKALGQIPPEARLPAHNPVRPNPRVLVETVRLYSDEVALDEARPGDVVVLAFEGRRVPRHLGILAGAGLVQLFPALSIRRVCEHSLDDYWRAMFLAAYRYKGVTR